ncbi:MAG TPA: carboxypeptidase regulatory-like domain-containing protein, partial [Pyrinomonadaceae bacterium]|nr:carboxypeptidase regulatory-like domain-containing protein [Pyrinomonadaceae bacterium]
MRRVIVLIGIAALFGVLAPQVEACSCAPRSMPCESYGLASAVFVGTVQSVRDAELSNTSWTPRVFRFSVDKAYLGVTGSEIEVSTGRGGGDCGYNFQVGQRYLVYAYLNRNNRLTTGICSRTTRYSQATEDLEFLDTVSSLPSGATIYGQVVRNTPPKKDAPPISDEVVVKIEGGEVQREVRPDAQGRYRVAGLPPGKFKVTVQLPEKFTVGQPEREVTISDRGCASVVFYIDENGRISGTVVDEAGRLIPRIMVSLVDPASNPREVFGIFDRTDEQGRFTLSSIPAGRYLIAVNFNRSPDPKDPTNSYRPTFYPGVAEQASAEVITLSVGEKLSELEVRVPLRRDTSVIKGQVVRADGSPVASALLSVRDVTLSASSLRRGVELDQEGRFTIYGYVG